VSGLVMLVPYGVLVERPENTSVSGFSYAFQYAGLEWASYVVSACASIGIITNVGISASQLAAVWCIVSSLWPLVIRSALISSSDCHGLAWLTPCTRSSALL